MTFDLYSAIMKDKGSDNKQTENDPLSSFLYTEENDNDYKDYGFYSTNVIPINLLFSGRVDEGIPIGKLSTIAAPPALGKSIIAMSTIKGAQRKNSNLVTILIDAEFSFDFDIARKFGIDISKEKLIVYRENSIEKVKNIVLKTIDNVPKEERKNIFIVIDSWGTLVSSKTIEDGLAGKDVADLTLPKKKNDLANILLFTRATVFVINHIYYTMDQYNPFAIPGGERLKFNSSCIVLISSKAKDKDKDKELLGHIMTAQTFKSRFSKERTVMKFRMKHSGGLDPFYGLLDDAIEGGYVIVGKVLDEKETKKRGENVYKDKKGTYQRAHIENDEPIKEKDLYNAKFWGPIFKDTDFKKYLEDKYQFRGDFDVVVQEDELAEMFSKKE